METQAGLRRCVCPRGVAKQATFKRKEPEPPVISTESAEMFTEMLAVLEYFPSDGGARMLIASQIRGMCRDMAEAKWLITRTVTLYRKWPGLIELRQVYCSKYTHPLDGQSAIGVSEVYPDGIPSERIETAPSLQLAGSVSASPSITATVSDLAVKTDLNYALTNPRRPYVRQIPVERIPPITEERRREIQVEIDRVRNEMLDQKAREEIGL
jgi:hypothetical protein